jgi:ribosomal protein L29
MTKAFNELKDQTVAELKALHLEESRKLFDVVNEMKTTKKIEKTHRIGESKKRIARILTALRQKEKA